MTIFEALALWRKIKPWLDKPWLKPIVTFIAGLFKSEPGEKPKITPHDPGAKKVTLDDIHNPPYH